jgi:site-specific recombinase XerC
MTATEQQALLAVTRDHPRDHMLISLGLGTGLRLQELLGLNVGDVTADGKTIRMRFPLDPAITKGGRQGEVFVSPRLARKLRSFLTWKRSAGQPMDAQDPLFLSQHGRRLSKRRTQQILKRWQQQAGFDRYYGFHCLRHYGEFGISGTRPLPTSTGPRGTCS